MPTRPRILIPIAAALVLALVLAAGAYSQPRFALYSPTWEYAHAFYYANYSIAICYAVTSAQGCRYEYINNSGNLMRAAAILGDQGWEHTHTVTDQSGYFTMYFKRPKPAP